MVTSILLVLAIYIFFTYTCDTCGFENPPPSRSGPAPVSITGRTAPPSYTDVSDLPGAPVNNLGETNSLPYQDPVMMKASSQMLMQLKQDMDGFSSFELVNMPDISDPAVKLPISRFKGDHQNIKDAISVMDRNPGLQPQISVAELNDAAANLRYLQRTYRTYSNNQMVPEPTTKITQVGLKAYTEGFTTFLTGQAAADRINSAEVQARMSAALGALMGPDGKPLFPGEIRLSVPAHVTTINPNAPALVNGVPVTSAVSTAIAPYTPKTYPKGSIVSHNGKNYIARDSYLPFFPAPGVVGPNQLWDLYVAPVSTAAAAAAASAAAAAQVERDRIAAEARFAAAREAMAAAEAEKKAVAAAAAATAEAARKAAAAAAAAPAEAARKAAEAAAAAAAAEKATQEAAATRAAQAAKETERAAAAAAAEKATQQAAATRAAQAAKETERAAAEEKLRQEKRAAFMKGMPVAVSQETAAARAAAQAAARAAHEAEVEKQRQEKRAAFMRGWGVVATPRPGPAGNPVIQNAIASGTPTTVKTVSATGTATTSSVNRTGDVTTKSVDPVTKVDTTTTVNTDDTTITKRVLPGGNVTTVTRYKNGIVVTEEINVFGGASTITKYPDGRESVKSVSKGGGINTTKEKDRDGNITTVTNFKDATTITRVEIRGGNTTTTTTQPTGEIEEVVHDRFGALISRNAIPASPSTTVSKSSGFDGSVVEKSVTPTGVASTKKTDANGNVIFISKSPDGTVTIRKETPQGVVTTEIRELDGTKTTIIDHPQKGKSTTVSAPNKGTITTVEPPKGAPPITTVVSPTNEVTTIKTSSTGATTTEIKAPTGEIKKTIESPTGAKTTSVQDPSGSKTVIEESPTGAATVHNVTAGGVKSDVQVIPPAAGGLPGVPVALPAARNAPAVAGRTAREPVLMPGPAPAVGTSGGPTNSGLPGVGTSRAAAVPALVPTPPGAAPAPPRVVAAPARAIPALVPTPPGAAPAPPGAAAPRTAPTSPSAATVKQTASSFGKVLSDYLSWASGATPAAPKAPGSTAKRSPSPPRVTTAGSKAKRSPSPSRQSPLTQIPTSSPTYSGDPNYRKITPTQLRSLIYKIQAEIRRLQASGTTDPIIQARVNVFRKMHSSLRDIEKQLKSGQLKSNNIPILVKDYNNFLPALGNNNAAIGGLLSKSGFPDLNSLFSSLSQGGISNVQIDNKMLQTYANALLSGLSYKFDISYTSPNEVAARQAESVKAAYEAGSPVIPNNGMMGPMGPMGQMGPKASSSMGRPKMTFRSSGPFKRSEAFGGHPMTMQGSRGAFESKVRQLDLQEIQERNAPVVRRTGDFDWKKRSSNIYENVKRAGLDPLDYGFNADVYNHSSKAEFSWRGYTNMVCNRLATNSEPGMPEKMGCPPASWSGWRS
jgi:chemotaxis protein histidine kinase CheA